MHLRFGRIARGGIRWSDRREDFRTEILGLVKAQQVKNAVIVPVGAKGGFYSKRMPVNPTREESMAVGVAAYKTFIGALLDITDNLSPEGAVIPPAGVLRLDGDDPLSGGGGRQGTATFSDLANAIAEEHGYWLGDAFASGGSHGYDHKKMGITARGAWEAIKRHFRETGTDIQNEDFTVVGGRDMSGDVFGNGMLLSRHIRLAAAFDHRHIFLDPQGDAEAAFQERERLFALPRSSWADYDKNLIGKGGGVFARTLKEIPLTPEVRKLIGSDAASLSPPALIKALLKAEVDLLWFGGIGTYVKASWQSHPEVGDRANDALRVDGAELRAKVVGEGANLGVTQPGRIEYARKGGRIDTDAVDNSAGVDTSDHEVNLKILLSGPARRGELPENSRDELLAAMTGDVAALVLRDNYDQTLALSVAEAQAVADLDAASRSSPTSRRAASSTARWNSCPAPPRSPSSAMPVRASPGPSYACFWPMPSSISMPRFSKRPADDAALADLLTGYFPPAALKAFPQEAARHRLRARDRLHRALQPHRQPGGAGLRPAHARAFGPRRRRCGARLRHRPTAFSGFRRSRRASTNSTARWRRRRRQAPMPPSAAHLQRVTPWFLAQPAGELVAATALYRAGVEALAALQERTPQAEAFAAAGLPEDLARRLGALGALAAAPDIARLAHGAMTATETVAALYLAISETLGLTRLRSLAEKLSCPSIGTARGAPPARRPWRGAERTSPPVSSPRDRKGLKRGRRAHEAGLARTRDLLAAIESAGELSVAKLMLASSQIQNLAGPSAPD